MVDKFDNIRGDSPTWNDESVVDLLDQYIAAGFNTTSPSGTANQEFRTVRAYLQQIYGPLPEGAVDYKASDLNGDKTNEVYAVDANGDPHTVYSYVDNEVVSTSYEDFKAANTTATDGETEDEDPALTELISQYGEEAVEDAQRKLKELESVLNKTIDDPFGTLEGIINKTASSSSSDPCGFQSVPGGTGIEEWVLDCVTVNAGLPIPFPIPGPLGSIFKGATVRDIKNAIENAGHEIGKVLSGETSVEEVLDKIVDGVVGKIQGIFGDADEVSVDSILGKIGDILVGGGYILAGDLYDEYFKDKVNSAIPGVPIIPYASSEDCQNSERYTADAEGNCGPCIDPKKTYDPIDNICVDPNVADTPTDGESVEDCNQLGRVHVPDASNETKGSCGGCKDDVNTVPDDPDNPDYSCVAPEDPNLQEGDPCNTGAPLNAEGKIGAAPDFDCVPNEGEVCNDPNTGTSGTIKDGLCDSGTPVTQCEDKFSTNYGEDGDCGPDCISGYSIKEGATTCSKDDPTVDPCETIDDTNADECGYKECNGAYIPKDQVCSPTVNPCDEAAYAADNPTECGTTTYTCPDPNATTNEDGSCGPCKTGYVYDGAVERCVQSTTPDPCLDASYAEMNPEQCGTGDDCDDCTCAEYAAANPEECATGPDTPSGGSSGGSGGSAGGSGMFDLESFEIAGDPQLLARMEFPITNFLEGMFKDYV